MAVRCFKSFGLPQRTHLSLTIFAATANERRVLPMRLIDAAAVKKLYKAECVGDCGCCSDLQSDCTCTLVDRVPTVEDAVVVVRCKDCGYFGKHHMSGYHACELYELPFCKPDDFCSHGERVAKGGA